MVLKAFHPFSPIIEKTASFYAPYTAPEIIIRDDADDGDVGYTWAVQLDEKRVLVVYYINFDRAKGTRHIQGSILEIEPQG